MADFWPFFLLTGGRASHALPLMPPLARKAQKISFYAENIKFGLILHIWTGGKKKIFEGGMSPCGAATD